MDEELGRLFSHLADRGLLDRTLLVVTSDHGEEFMEHGRLEHARTMFQEVLRVPLLISGPGIPEGRRVREPVSLLDIVPTLLGQQGIAPPPSLEGLDLAPLWSLPAAATAFEERVLFGEAPGAVGPVAEKLRYQSVRRGRYKLHHEAVRGRYTLFDLESDPREQNDILGREPDIGAELREAMRERFQGQEDARPELSLDAEDSDRLRALGYVP